MNFISELQKQSDHLRLETLCRSFEGREVPLLIVGDPLPASPLELRHDPRLVVYIQANIHAGEVEGKEASLMLLRDLLQGKYPNILRQTVLLIAPIFNADGNEKISPQNRRNQKGPEKGVGIRYNGQGLDINRDAMKVETPEMAGLLQNVLLRWDPALLIDCHTTNGSYHEEPVTYSWVLNPNGDPEILAYMRDTMMPSIRKILQDMYNILSIPYGNFVNPQEPEKGWRTFSHLPRFITNYIGLRNRMAILIENYAYAEYRTRIMGNYFMLLSILEYCIQNRDKLLRLIQGADARMKNADYDSFAVEVELKPLPQPLTIRGYRMEVVEARNGRKRVRPTKERKTYKVPYYADFQARRSVALPVGYLILPKARDILPKLLQHGLLVEGLTDSTTLEVEIFQITELHASKRPYQGHYLNRVKGRYVKRKMNFPAGTLFVPVNQPLGRLAAALLEPESDDGLLVWNFFDRHLVPQWGRGYSNYPVCRLRTKTKLAKRTIH